jgi:hypothetical protein
MTDESDFSEKSGDPLAPPPPVRPKRGAIPTPQSEIDKATPYVPDNEKADDDTEPTPSPSTNGDSEEEH